MDDLKRIRVGIPRAMGYYYLYPFMRALIRELGGEPVLSPPTNKRTMTRMDLCPTDEPCLAVKLHFSHADALASREDVDFLFLPIIARVERSYCCPKFIGISDMTRHGLQLPRERCLAPVVDFSDNDGEMARCLRPLAERLGVTNSGEIRRAIKVARAEQQRFRDLCVSHELTTPEAYHFIDNPESLPSPPDALSGPTIAVIGHPYVLYELISQGMIDRLRGYGRVLTAEMVDTDEVARAMTTIPDGRRMWPFEAQLLGAALHLLRAGKIDKMILVGSFECGPESIIETFIEQEAHRRGIPLMVLALDEHSGEAGLVTRLEAFMDTEKIPSASHAEHPTPHIDPREEMVVGVPSMGNLDIAIRSFIESFGVKTVRTPRTTKTCIELGREIAPEFVCFPFTATLGQMRYMLEHGANTLMMLGGKQFCRLGWYAQVQEQLLRGLGHDFRMLIVDSPFPLREKLGRFNKTMKAMTNNASWPHIIQEMRLAHRKLTILDRADEIAHRLRAFERVQGTIDRILDRFIARVSGLHDKSALDRAERDFHEQVAGIETEDTNPVRVRIVGEIWVVLEQSANREVERKLGASANPRVWVQREHSASRWFDSHILHQREPIRREGELLAAASPWLSHQVGGHGIFTLGQAALSPREGVDGLLHIFPFTCMPEIIAQNILVRMAEELDLPVLTYIISEQMGEAGMETRLESFLDLLEERRYARGTGTELMGACPAQV